MLGSLHASSAPVLDVSEFSKPGMSWDDALELARASSVQPGELRMFCFQFLQHEDQGYGSIKKVLKKRFPGHRFELLRGQEGTTTAFL